ncbi:MAG TPA: DHHA1 domain-containing protein [Feifaniaceae bacterium]|nr:DHHA1 domain-containing protein [Feifaniaceae bacterium]
MTEKLYLDDSYLTSAQAKVIACTPAGGGFDVELDKTVLFPTGGGQPHDTGFIGGIAVLDVTEDGERVLHRTAEAIPVGSTAEVSIDWPRRFDHMQQHSGEHILSFAAKELFDAKNVGFHMAASYCTVDLDKPLGPGDAEALERRTNELIYANLPVTLTYVEAEELNNMQLRKVAAGLTGTVRIVAMPGGDSCTCCGTHVNATGEIGLVKVTAHEHYKGGERLTFACGTRALIHAQAQQNIVDAIARSFSCKAEAALDALNKVQQEAANAKRENKALYAKVSGYLADELLKSASAIGRRKLIARLIAELPAAQLRPLALKLCEEHGMLALLLAAENGQMQYVLAGNADVGLDMGELAQAVNTALNGRGGGRGTLAQGSAKDTPAARDAIEGLERYLGQRLKK